MATEQEVKALVVLVLCLFLSGCPYIFIMEQDWYCAYYGLFLLRNAIYMFGYPTINKRTVPSAMLQRKTV